MEATLISYNTYKSNGYTIVKLRQPNSKKYCWRIVELGVTHPRLMDCMQVAAEAQKPPTGKNYEDFFNRQLTIW